MRRQKSVQVLVSVRVSSLEPRRRKGNFLGEQVPDFLVHVAQEVDVGRGPEQPAVLDQEVDEDALHLVVLSHDLQLEENRKQMKVQTSLGLWIYR